MWRATCSFFYFNPHTQDNHFAGKPQISWNAVDGATKYWIYRSIDGKTLSTTIRPQRRATQINQRASARLTTTRSRQFALQIQTQTPPTAPLSALRQRNKQQKTAWDGAEFVRRHLFSLSDTKALAFVYHDKSEVFAIFHAKWAKIKQNTGKSGPWGSLVDRFKALFSFSEPKNN